MAKAKFDGRMTNLRHPGDVVIGYGWCGTFRGRSKNRLGWLMPNFVSHNDSASLTREQKRALKRIPDRQYATADMWRVKITIEAVTDKRGRFIVKRASKPKAKVHNA